jgi:hypothetical protein
MVVTDQRGNQIFGAEIRGHLAAVPVKHSQHHVRLRWQSANHMIVLPVGLNVEKTRFNPELFAAAIFSQFPSTAPPACSVASPGEWPRPQARCGATVLLLTSLTALLLGASKVVVCSVLVTLGANTKRTCSVFATKGNGTFRPLQFIAITHKRRTLQVSRRISVLSSPNVSTPMSSYSSRQVLSCAEVNPFRNTIASTCA